MDMNPDSKFEAVSSAAEAVVEAASHESAPGEVAASEACTPPFSDLDPHSKDTPPNESVQPPERGSRLALLPLRPGQEEIPSLGRAREKPKRKFVAKGLAAGLALIALAGAGAAYQHERQTTLLATKFEENEHLVSTVANLRERLDAIEATRARDESADVRKLLGEMKSAASATRDTGVAVAQLTTRMDRIERDQGARLDKLGERLDHEASTRLADLSARTDRLEKRIASPGVAPPSKGEDLGAAITQLTARLDHIDRDQSARQDKAVERIDHDSAARFADLAARLDRLEKKAVPPAVAASAPAVSPKQAANPASVDPGISNETTGSIERARPPLRGYAVLGVRDGFAMIEGREGAISVAPGDSIPGLGRVLRIERHGHVWAVVTSLGVIEEGPEPY